MKQVIGLRFKGNEIDEIDREANKQMRSRANLLKLIIKKYLEENARNKN